MKFSYGLAWVSLLAIPMPVLCMGLASSKPTRIVSAPNKTYTLISNDGTKFTVDDLFIKKCDAFPHYDISGVFERVYAPFIPLEIHLPVSSQELHDAIQLISQLPVTKELPNTTINELMQGFHMQSLNGLLHITRPLEALQVNQILPILYKTLDNKLHEPDSKALLCNNAAYAQRLFTYYLQDDLRRKVSDSKRIKKNLQTLALIAALTPDSITALTISSNGRYLVSGSRYKTIKIWNIEDPSNITCITTLTGHTSTVNIVQLSTDDKYLFSASCDGKIKIWDIENLYHATCATTLSAHTDNINMLQISNKNDRQYLFSASVNGTINVWDISNPYNVIHVNTLCNNSNKLFCVNILKVHTNGDYLFSSFDKTIDIWNIKDPYHVTHITTLNAHEEAIKSLQMSSDGNYLFSASGDRTITIWNITNPCNILCIATLAGHADGVNTLQISLNGKHLFSASHDKTIKIWDIANPYNALCIATLAGHNDWINILQISQNGKYLFSASHDKTIKIWDIADPHNAIGVATLTDHTKNITNLHISSDDRYLFSASQDHTIKIWNLRTVYYPANNLLLEHDYIIDLAAQAKEAGINHLTTKENAHMLAWYESMPPQLQKIVAPYCMPVDPALLRDLIEFDEIYF